VQTLLPEATLLHTQIVACVVPAVITLLAVASLALPGHFVAEAKDPHLVLIPPPTAHYARYNRFNEAYTREQPS
jgi:hypothetical protein